jgi:site-specific recombinase XerD
MECDVMKHLVDLYLQARTGFRAPGTLDHYSQALKLFAEQFPVFPAEQHQRVSMLSSFTQRLLTEGYKASTAKLYATNAKQFLRWLATHDHLPTDFPVQKAIAELTDVLSGSVFKSERRAPEPPEGIERLLDYHVSLSAGGDEMKALEHMRDTALIHCLANSGGRVSEVLSLHTSDFPDLAEETVLQGDFWRIAVNGKGNHTYELWLQEAVFYVREYMEAREVTAKQKETLFVRHSGKYRGEDLAGKPLSRQAALWIVASAARALGIGRITPHDFRHWRASQLLNAGVPLDVVQLILGHVSIETTRQFYAHTDKERIVEALRGSV